MIQTTQWTANQAAPNAFAERKALMPMWGGIDVPEEQWQTIWQTISPKALNQDGLAYIHIPFCASHCVFCGFYRNAWKEDYSQCYVDKVIEELAHEAKFRKETGHHIQAVYFGGGTPTALHTQDLVRLIEACYCYLPLSDDCEFTLEGRISHFGLEKAQACIDAGVNRISVGIQTFNSALRKRMGRKHGGEEAYDYLKQLSELDAVIVADLIFGLPEQTDEIWQDDVAKALSLPLSGLDMYAFNCYPFLPINKLIKHGTLSQPIHFSIQAQHYAYTVEKCLQAGWQQVSNNHFAHPNRGERNRYNRLVKSDMPCLAFGSGAGGNIGGYSYQVEGDLQKYLANPPLVKALSYLSQHGKNKTVVSCLQHDLELGYFDTTLFQANPQAQQAIEQWQDLSLLQIDKNGIAQLNTSGRYWSPTLIRQLVMSLSQ